MTDILEKFFNARVLAVVGASADPAKLGGRLVRQNRQLNFAGRLIPVNAHATDVQGYAAMARVEDLPDNVDCAVVALPAAAVEAAVRSLSVKRVPLVVILSSGFAEHSLEGAAAQARILKQARTSGMRIVGPNSMGGLSIENAMSATFTSINEHEGRTFPPLGSVSIASQSGFVGSHMLGVLRDRGLGIAKWLATGNQPDIDIADVIAHYARDRITRTIVAYLEGAGRADALRQAFDLARQHGKHVVVLKAGRSELGARAVASHTSALVGNADIFDAILRRHGVIGVATLDELADVVSALDTGRKIGGSALGVATVSGGFGILISDAAEEHGFELPELAPHLQADVRKAHALATTRNPVDMGSLVHFESAIAALHTQGYDALVIAAGHFGLVARQAEQLAGLLMAARVREPDRFIALVANLTEPWRRHFQQMGVFVCEDPARVVRALAAVRSAAIAVLQQDSIPDVPHVEPLALLAGGGEFAARNLLRAIGIPVVDDILVHGAGEAEAAARTFGNLVVLKVVSPDVPHKSEAGGVRLGVSPAQAAGVYDDIIRRVSEYAPAAHITGVLVSPMIEGGIETIIGLKRDAIFGPVVMFGLGGVFAEIFRDTAVEVAPFGILTAHAMIRATKGYQLLKGARGRPSADVDALAGILSRLSVFACEHADTITEMEINPLLALPGSALALDALVIVRGDATSGGAHRLACENGPDNS